MKDGDTNIEALLYPFQGDLAEMYTNVICSGSTLKDVTLYDVQGFVDGSFASGANVSVAKPSTGAFTFRSIGGLLAVTATGQMSIKEVELSGNNGETLAGKYDVDVQTMALTNKEAKTSVKIVPGTPVDINTAKTFVFVLAPTNFTKGFTIKFTDTEGNTYTKSSSTAHNLQRAHKAAIAVTVDDQPAVPQPWKANVAGKYDVTEITGVSSEKSYCNTGANHLSHTIYKAAEYPCTWDECNFLPNNKDFIIQMHTTYNTQFMAFSITSTEIAGKTGCYALDIQDRGGNGMETVVDNGSYYNSNDGSLVFDFDIPNSSRAFCALFQRPLDVSGTYTVNLQTSVAFPDINQKLSNSFQNRVWKTSDIGSYNDGSLSPSPKGQAFFIQYNQYPGNVFFFNVSREEVTGKTGCLKLIDIQDRPGGNDQVTDGGSYYDTVNKVLFFDIKKVGAWATEAYCATLTLSE